MSEIAEQGANEMELTAKVKCPNCGKPVTVISAKQHQTAVWYCDSEDGGCDERFVVEMTARLSVITFKISKETTK